MNIDESVDSDVDSKMCAEAGRGDNEGVESDVGAEVRSSDNEGFEL